MYLECLLLNYHLFCMHDQIREDEFMEEIHNSELISTLRSIIAEQQSRILQLEQDLKKWEKKYKEEFFKDNRNVISKSTVDKSKSSEYAMLNFTKEFTQLQARFERKSLREREKTEIKGEYSPNDILQCVEKLYRQIEQNEKENKSKTSTIEEQSTTIEKQNVTIDDLKRKIDNFLREYEANLRKSEDYEDRLLEEIRRQEQTISRMRQR